MIPRSISILTFVEGLHRPVCLVPNSRICFVIHFKTFSQRLISRHRNNLLYTFNVNKMSTSELFTGENQAELYAKFRPRYSNEVFQKIISYCKETTNSLDFALDLGCGSGQSTVPLAKYFKTVVGTDVSPQQISNAPTDITNLSFSVGTAEDLCSFKDNSVNLVTIAQAFHWVDQRKFFPGVDRVLKPGGTLVVYGYGMWKVAHPEIFSYLMYIYADILGELWPAGRKMVEEKYSSVSLPYPGWIRDDTVSLTKEVSLEDLIGYIGSWSAFHKYDQMHPGNTLMAEARNRLIKLAGIKDEETSDLKTSISWPVFLLMAHKPL